MRKEFVEQEFDLEGKTFTGSILWDQTRWDYHMIFSKDWRTIESGTLMTPNGSMAFGTDLKYTKEADDPSPLFIVASMLEMHPYLCEEVAALLMAVFGKLELCYKWLMRGCRDDIYMGYDTLT